ncbi:hypothetical protein [Halobellus rubicundus]|uniref:Uncharacterized protein n=1 Tax=Halobellus rubicundus TaxID=2996466 RepID=A0ABD5MF78_9EURY
MSESIRSDEMVKFLCYDEFYGEIPEPRPANREVPKWFREMDNTFGDGKSTVTQCRPFLDAMTLGWIVPLADHVRVEADEDGTINFRWNFDIPLLHRQEEGVMSDESPFGGVSIFQWLSPWRIQVPENHSVLVTAPMNRREPRFSVFSGVIDADQGFFNLNCPFIWEQIPYDGWVKKGTPIVQVIPFNRDGIVSDGEIRSMNPDEEKIAEKEDQQKIEQPSRYKNEKWVPKRGSRVVAEKLDDGKGSGE